MGYWDYENVGASATPENIKHVQKIFEYIGFAPKPYYDPEGDETFFINPVVYCCKYSANERESGQIKKAFVDMDDKQLLYLLNALFPKTNVYVHHAEGNDTSDTWENHDIIYDTEDMTCLSFDSYTDYGGDGPNGKRSSKARFILDAPKEEYICHLIDISIKDKNTELATLLQNLSQKLKNGLFVLEDNSTDTREIGEEYDIEDDIQEFGYYDEDEEDEYEEDEEDEEDEDEIEESK